MSSLDITPYRSELREPLIALAIEAWDPVFAKTRAEVPAFVYDAFYPQGWRVRHAAEIASLLETEPENVWVALRDGAPIGFVGVRLHPEDQMGEVHILAVAPAHQRRGIGRALLTFAERRIRAAGLAMVMVETVDDSGHAPARRSYEAFGFERWPVARYFKPL